ncbi:MAG: TDP-4-oxo-6-deoxy-D-glucose transaminase [Syntrophorhabdus sp. PtaU1.Bin050]|nr:MAG: TDP-4-oxo-6-deoxy-D-glucose transaminase [Syntrophorhabdus sp. PtaU1.Bin050]
MGRDALSLTVSALKLGPDDAIVLPAYLCTEVLRPFVGRTRVQFYDVQADLTIDPEKVETILKRSNAKALVMINYFGFLQPYRFSIKQICTNRGIILIEDSAHSLLTEGSGETGDVVIYSFRKILPLPDGGGLKVNTGTINMRPQFYPRTYSNTLSMLIMIKALLNVRADFLSRAALSSAGKSVVPEATTIPKKKRILPLSSLASNGMGNISFSDIRENRRRDYRFWQEQVRKSKTFIPLFPDLPFDVCPLCFPVIVEERDSIKQQLQAKGIYLKVYWNLPWQIGKEFVNSHYLSSRTLALPVYPELGPREREEISKLLAS